MRGTASQVFEKYQALARDAHSSGDRIAAENYLQHAEHYCRLLNAGIQNERQRQQQDPASGGNPQPAAGAAEGSAAQANGGDGATAGEAGAQDRGNGAQDRGHRNEPSSAGDDDTPPTPDTPTA